MKRNVVEPCSSFLSSSCPCIFNCVSVFRLYRTNEFSPYFHKAFCVQAKHKAVASGAPAPGISRDPRGAKLSDLRGKVIENHPRASSAAAPKPVSIKPVEGPRLAAKLAEAAISPTKHAVPGNPAAPANGKDRI